jgi:hypothetical protein
MTAIVGHGVEARDTVEHVRFIRFEPTTLITGDIPALNTEQLFKRGLCDRSRINLCIGNVLLSAQSPPLILKNLYGPRDVLLCGSRIGIPPWETGIQDPPLYDSR